MKLSSFHLTAPVTFFNALCCKVCLVSVILLKKYREDGQNYENKTLWEFVTLGGPLWNHKHAHLS